MRRQQDSNRSDASPRDDRAASAPRGRRLPDVIGVLLATGQYDLAFEKIYERLFGKVFGFIAANSAAGDDAEDLTRDVFLRVCRHLPHYDAARSLETWVYVTRRTPCLTAIARDPASRRGRRARAGLRVAGTARHAREASAAPAGDRPPHRGPALLPRPVVAGHCRHPGHDERQCPRASVPGARQTDALCRHRRRRSGGGPQLTPLMTRESGFRPNFSWPRPDRDFFVFPDVAGV